LSRRAGLTILSALTAAIIISLNAKLVFDFVRGLTFRRRPNHNCHRLA